MRKKAQAKIETCRECSLRDLHPRLGEALAFLERMRREDETLVEVFRRFVIGHALEVTDGHQGETAKLLSMSQQGVALHIQRERERKVNAALPNQPSPRPRIVEAPPALPPPTQAKAPEASATVGPVVAESKPADSRPPVRHFDRNGKEVAFFRGGKPIFKEDAISRVLAAD